MPIQISLHGTREGVSRELKALKQHPEDKDGSQLVAVKAFVEAEIKALSPEFNAVKVDASGDAQAGGRSVSVTVIGQKLHI